MNKKDELKRLIRERDEDKGFFGVIPYKIHLIMAIIVSPIMILSAITDWIFNLGWVSQGNFFRIVLIVMGVLIPVISWMQYDTKVREEKKENEKIDKLIDELNEK